MHVKNESFPRECPQKLNKFTICYAGSYTVKNIPNFAQIETGLYINFLLKRKTFSWREATLLPFPFSIPHFSSLLFPNVQLVSFENQGRGIRIDPQLLLNRKFARKLMKK